MNAVFPILQINSSKDVLKLANFDQSIIIDFGNGFWISNSGLIASVAHVLKSSESINSYGLIEDKLFKIEILARFLTHENGNHKDIAIGKINISKTDYFDPIRFEEVELFSKLKIVGYSRKLLTNNNLNQKDLLKYSYSLIEMQCVCMDLKYYWSERLIEMKNFFTIATEYYDLGGMSGCPLLNDKNLVVGIFKGGAQVGNQLKGQVVGSEVLKQVYLSLSNKMIKRN